MKLADLFEARSQEIVHHNPSVATLKALARNNRYHSARFVITKDGDVVAGDSEHFTHLSMAPYMGAWEVRGYVQYMGDGEYAYRSMEVYSALNKDHPIFRIWERAGIENGNPDQSHLKEYLNGRPGPVPIPPRSPLFMPYVSMQEAWSRKYKKSINCANPRGFSQRAHCAARKRRQAGKPTKSKSVNESIQIQLAQWVLADQKPRNLYAQFVKHKHGGDYQAARSEWMQQMGTTDEDFFGTAAQERRVHAQIDRMWNKLPFDSFKPQDWDNLWLLVQHADHAPHLQQRLLAKLKQYDHVGGNSQHVKYLTDRMRVNQNSPQRYHTQSGEWQNKLSPHQQRRMDLAENDLSYNAWIRYTPESLHADWSEYVHKQDAKWHTRAKQIGARWPLFTDIKQFKHSLDQAQIVNVDDLGDVENMTRNHSLADIKGMVGGYQNPRDVDRIVSGLHAGVPLPLPIILKGRTGMWIQAGNTRQATARVLGVTPKALLVDVSTRP